MVIFFTDNAISAFNEKLITLNASLSSSRNSIIIKVTSDNEKIISSYIEWLIKRIKADIGTRKYEIIKRTNITLTNVQDSDRFVGVRAYEYIEDGCDYWPHITKH